MKSSKTTSILAIVSLSLVSACNQAPPSRSISYSNDVVPVLQANCLQCHNKNGEGYKASGLNMESYSTLMKGTKFGPVVIPGNSTSSTLVRLISGKADPSITMPHGGMQLLKEQDISAIVLWIDQGAKDN